MHIFVFKIIHIVDASLEALAARGAERPRMGR